MKLPAPFELMVAAALLLTPARADPPALVAAGFVGGAGADDLQGAAAGANGTIYVVGNTAQALAALPGGVTPARLGPRAADPLCGRGFVARLDPGGTNFTAAAEFAEGILILTSVQVSPAGVYVGGYATEALAPLLADKPGLLRDYPLAESLARYRAERAASTNAASDPLAGRPGLGRCGAPCLLRLSPGLQRLECGTYLEGWQQVWDKVRNRTIRPNTTFPREFFWQPTAIGLLSGGDVVVTHDGGYSRPLTEAERADTSGAGASLGFYDMCDWVSRLSPDLSARAWRQAVYTPAVDPAAAARSKPGWKLRHFGNPRTHRLRVDGADNLYLCGWSASATSREPWWAPYIWKLAPAGGEAVWKAYEYDPFSGGENRMGGQVADTAVWTMALDGDTNVLAALCADGGNSVMEWSPSAQLGKPFEGRWRGSTPGVKLVHWWGRLVRFDARTKAALGGARLGSTNPLDRNICGPAWVTDVASAVSNGVVAVGRCDLDFPWSADAWTRGETEAYPMAFLRVYAADFELRFSTALPGLLPFELVRLSPSRYLVVGQALAAGAPVKGVARPFNGPSDGYYMIVELKRGT